MVFFLFRLIPCISCISKCRKCYWNVIMVVVFQFKNHFNKRIKTFLSQTLKIWCGVISQFINSLMADVFFFFQKILDSSIFIRNFFINSCPFPIFILLRKTDFYIRCGLALCNVQNMTRQLILCFLRKGKSCD